MKIKGSVVVITGASSGIGRATALRFAKAGADVVLAARRKAVLEEVAEECQVYGVRALAVATDVSDAEAVEKLATRAAAHFGRIDIWVNNAAVSLFGRLTDTPMEDFRRVIDVNVMGYVYGAHAALTQMTPRGKGVIINVSSVVGEVPQPYTAAYSMSKAAVRALSISLRSELALHKLHGIKVATVLPPTIDTPLFHQVANYTGREVVPMPPVYSPQRVARVIVNAARSPRRELVIGAMGRQLLVQHKVSPGMAEGMMAVQVDKTHLSRKRPAPDSAGNLFESGADELADIEGGWHGRRRTAVRRVATVGVLAGSAVGSGVLVVTAVKAVKAKNPVKAAIAGGGIFVAKRVVRRAVRRRLDR